MTTGLIILGILVILYRWYKSIVKSHDSEDHPEQNRID